LRGLGGITDVLDQVLGLIGVEVAAWTIPAVLVLVFIALIPWIRKNHRTNEARELVRRIASEERVDRAQLQTETLSTVADHPLGLVVVADEAIRLGLHPLARLATDRLASFHGYRQDLRRLQALLDGRPRVHIEGAQAAIERLLAQGLLGAARHRLEDAQQHWPDEPGLHELQRRIEE